MLYGRSKTEAAVQQSDGVRQERSQSLEVLVIGLFNCVILIATFGTPVLAWLAWSHPYAVLPPVITYFLISHDGSEHRDGRPWPRFAENFWVFQSMRSYFNMEFHLDPALEPSSFTGDEKFIFCLHPHGVLSDYRVVADGMMRRYFPKLRSWRVLAASALFKIPLVRDIALWTHCIDASRKSAQNALEKGHSLLVIPGGEHEQVLGRFGKEAVYLSIRMGFVKLALRNRTPLVPAYVFGANDVYRTSTILEGLRLAFVNKLRIAVPIFWGRWGLPIPCQVPIRIVFGAPIKFSTNVHTDSSQGEVSDQELQSAHHTYTTALKKLFDDNKVRFGYADRELRVL